MKRLNYGNLIKEAADIILYLARIVLERSTLSKDSTRKRSVKVFIPLLLIVYLITIPFSILFSFFPEFVLLSKSFYNFFEFSLAIITTPTNLPELEIYIPTSLFQIIPDFHITELLATWLLLFVVILFVKHVNEARFYSLIKEFGFLTYAIRSIVKNSAMNIRKLKKTLVSLILFTFICSFISYFIIPTGIYKESLKYIIFLWSSLFICFIMYNNKEEIRKSRKFIIYLITTIFMVFYFSKVEGEFSTATKGLFLMISLILLFDRIFNSYFELKSDILNGKDPVFCFLYFSEGDFDKLKRHIIINKVDSDIKDQLNLGMCYLFGSDKSVTKATKHFEKLINENEKYDESEENDQIYALIAYLYAKCVIENKDSENDVKNIINILNELKENEFYNGMPTLIYLTNILIIDALAYLDEKNYNEILSYCNQNKYLIWYVLPSRQIYLLAKSLIYNKDYDKAKFIFRKYYFDPEEYSDVNYLIALMEINSEKPDFKLAIII